MAAGYIALLRGINVGGNNLVKMAELREALSAGGLSRVRTSGNVLLESEEDWNTMNKLLQMSRE